MTLANLAGWDSVAATAAEWRAIVPTKTPAVIGSYYNGSFANNKVAKAAFPKARHICYDVNGSAPEADILDIEPGNAVPSGGPSWSRKYKGTLPHPGLYASASTVSRVITDMLDAGFKRDGFLIHSAHYTGVDHICGPGSCSYPQADGTQYADHGLKGQNTDLNSFAPHFFTEPTPPFNPHYGWFDTTHRVLLAGYSEQTLVKAYDKYRATQTATSHPNKVKLALLRVLCGRAAARLGTLPADSADRRAWRKRELIDRANGMRLV